MSKIMLASADLFLKKRVVEILKQLGSELSHHCSNSSDTLIEFPKVKPDILIFDTLLPGPEGLEILKKLNGLKENATLIAVSSLRRPLFIEKLFYLGAKDVLVPPFEDTTLATVILHRLESIIE